MSARNTGFSLPSTEALSGIQAFAHTSPPTFQTQLGVPSYPLGETTIEPVIPEQGLRLSCRSLCGLGSVTSLLYAFPFPFCKMGAITSA